jgi:amino acid permease
VLQYSNSAIFVCHIITPPLSSLARIHTVGGGFFNLFVSYFGFWFSNKTGAVPTFTTTDNDDNCDKPKKSPNDAFRRVVWALGMFYFISLVYIYIFTPYHSRHLTSHPPLPSKPPKSPNDTSKRVVWASGTFFNYIYI